MKIHLFIKNVKLIPKKIPFPTVPGSDSGRIPSAAAIFDASG